MSDPLEWFLCHLIFCKRKRKGWTGGEGCVAGGRASIIDLTPLRRAWNQLAPLLVHLVCACGRKLSQLQWRPLFMNIYSSAKFLISPTTHMPFTSKFAEAYVYRLLFVGMSWE